MYVLGVTVCRADLLPTCACALVPERERKKNRLGKKNVFGKCGITTAAGREGTEGEICQLCVNEQYNNTTTRKDWCWTATNGGGVEVCGLELVRAVGITTTTKNTVGLALDVFLLYRALYVACCVSNVVGHQL
jgi:hypothetical protein